jgi:photosystem II stability/assembly factor-like uncharacterized protein
MVGSEGFMARTRDGGHTWTRIETPTKEDTLTSVFFINEQAGWAVGYDNTILYTKDGGTTWKKAVTPSLLKDPVPLASVSFADSLHGWAVGGLSNPTSSSPSTPSNIILATDDGGLSWHIVEL